MTCICTLIRSIHVYIHMCMCQSCGTHVYTAIRKLPVELRHTYICAYFDVLRIYFHIFKLWVRSSPAISLTTPSRSFLLSWSIYVYMNVGFMYVHWYAVYMYTCIHVYMYICFVYMHWYGCMYMGWLRSVGSIKL